MSETDSFIEEVTEEVRRDRLFTLMRRYGWIAVLAVLVLVGGAAWNEWRKAQVQARAEAAGDRLLAALDLKETDDRVAALQAQSNDTQTSAGVQAVIALLMAAEMNPQSTGAEAEAEAASGAPTARASLEKIAANGEVPAIYRQIAGFKAATLGGDDLSAQERRTRLDGLNTPGNPLRLLASEQLALLDISEGDSEAALERLQEIVIDAEGTAALRQRAGQLIIALGAEPQTVAGLENGPTGAEN